MNDLSRFLVYTLSLPERAVRSSIGLAAGTVREAATMLVPRAFQDAQTYRIVVRNSLRFLVEKVGGMPATGAAGATQQQIDDTYLARKAVGNFVDLASLMTLHVSPAWFLAIASDVAYGSRAFLEELSGELKSKGLIAEGSTIESVDDVLDAIRDGSGQAARMFDTPPLSVDELRQSLKNVTDVVRGADFKRVMPAAEVERFWNEMRDIARREDLGVLEVSGALSMHALGRAGKVAQGTWTGLRVAGEMFNEHVLSHYWQALAAMREKGFYATVRDSCAPYVEGVWSNFAAARPTVTEDVVSGRFFARLWQWIKQRFTRRPRPERGPA